MKTYFRTDDHVPFSEKFGYWCGAMGYVFSMAVTVFIVYYGTENLAISAAAVGTMMMVVKIIDGVTDAVGGILVDKTKAKTGKARPWFIRVAIPYGIVLFLTFCIPTGWGTTAKLIALAVMYILTVSVFGTMVGVAKYSLIARMSMDPKERSTMATIGDGSAVVFSSLLMTVTFSLVANFGYALIFAIYGVIGAVLCILCYVFVREQPEEIEGAIREEKEHQQANIAAIVKTLATNKYALLVFLYTTILYIGCGLIQTGGTYYATYVFGNYSVYSQFMLAGTIGSAVGIFAGTFIVRAIGSKWTFALGCLLTVVAYLPIIFTNSTSVITLVISFFFVIMFSQVFTNTQTPVMIAAAADYGEWKTGVRSEGVTSGIADIGIKIGQALASGLFGLILTMGGYQEGGVEQTASAIFSIKAAFTYVIPAVFLILGIFFLITYRLEKQHGQILADLEERHKAEGAQA